MRGDGKVEKERERRLVPDWVRHPVFFIPCGLSFFAKMIDWNRVLEMWLNLLFLNDTCGYQGYLKKRGTRLREI